MKSNFLRYCLNRRCNLYILGINPSNVLLITILLRTFLSVYKRSKIRARSKFAYSNMYYIAFLVQLSIPNLVLNIYQINFLLSKFSWSASCWRKPGFGRMGRDCRIVSNASCEDMPFFIMRYAATTVADLDQPITQFTTTSPSLRWTASSINSVVREKYL